MQNKYVASHKASQKGVAVLILFSLFITVCPFLPLCATPATKHLIPAGCCFSGTEERIAVTRLLDSIEEDLGWAAKYRVNDLYWQWGWQHDLLNS